MKKLHLSYKNNITSINEFTNDEYIEINDIINEFILNSKMKWAFEVINRNFSALFNTTDNLLKSLSKEDLNWEKLEFATLEINRNVLNYLASLNTFLDQTKKFLSRKFGKNSKESEEFDKKTNELFDKYFSYRFLYKLRNFTVHCGFSLCGISIESNDKQITFTPKFIYEDLMQDKSFWGTIVKADLEQIGDDFKAFDLFNESLNHFKFLSDFIQNNYIKDEENIKKSRIFEIIQIPVEEIDNYCFLIENNEGIKIAEIPVHYLK